MPSGHTQSAVGILLLSMGIIDMLRQPKPSLKAFKLLIFFLGIGWVCLIGLSRIYLNAHSKEQVFVGAVVGIIWASMILAVEKHNQGMSLLTTLISIVSLLCVWHLFYPVYSIPRSYSQQLSAYAVLAPTHPPLYTVVIFTTLSLIMVVTLKWYKQIKPAL